MSKTTTGSSSYEADDDAEAFNRTGDKFTLVQVYSWAIYCELRWMKHSPGRHYHIAAIDDYVAFHPEMVLPP